MELVDTHCHIQSIEADSGERHTRELWAKAKGLTTDRVIADATKAEVTKMVCVGCDLEDSKLAVGFVQKHAEAWASIGIHPHEAAAFAANKKLLDEFAGLATKPKVVAVGECGFDFYYNHSPKDVQATVLKFQLELAQKHGLPVIFHVREAFDGFWPIYDQYKVRGVLHSFTDTPENLQQALKRRLYIGLNGITTFTKNEEQLAMYKAIPTESLVFETDAPFLTPTPYRGTINEPKYVRNITEFMAQLRGESLESLAAASSRNASALFGI